MEFKNYSPKIQDAEGVWQSSAFLRIKWKKTSLVQASTGESVAHAIRDG